MGRPQSEYHTICTNSIGRTEWCLPLPRSVFFHLCHINQCCGTLPSRTFCLFAVGEAAHGENDCQPSQPLSSRVKCRSWVYVTLPALQPVTVAGAIDGIIQSLVSTKHREWKNNLRTRNTCFYKKQAVCHFQTWHWQKYRCDKSSSA